MTELTAIDILIEPDPHTLSRAADQNARLRKHAPEGFPLDASHSPHITLLQRYVRTSTLDAMFAVIEARIRACEPASLSFTASAIRHMPVAALEGMGIAAIVATPGPGVLGLQAGLIEAIEPFTAAGGTAAAFATTPTEPAINVDTLAYVERYVPAHSSQNYVAHVTIGLAPLAFLDTIEAEPLEAFAVLPRSIAVYQLGNNGTARKRLKAWSM